MRQTIGLKMEWKAQKHHKPHRKRGYGEVIENQNCTIDSGKLSIN